MKKQNLSDKIFRAFPSNILNVEDLKETNKIVLERIEKEAIVFNWEIERINKIFQDEYGKDLI